MPMVSHIPPKAVAPIPPAGPTTLAGLGSIIVGLVIAVLSLFDVVPTPEDVQQLGVIVGGVLALGAFVVTAISRTKQANNLAKLAQAERLAARPTLADKIERVTIATQAIAETPDAEPDDAGLTNAAFEGHAAYLVGQPTDSRLEVPNGSIRPPGVDVGGEAPLVDPAGYLTDESEVRP